MKKTLAILLLSIVSCSATFFDEYRIIPYYIGDQQFNPNGWVSKFGSLTGGELFFTDLYSSSWDFTNTPYRMQLLEVFSNDWEHYYRVPNKLQVKADSFVISEPFPVGGVAFFGAVGDVPENGSTIFFLGFACMSVILWAYKTQ